MTKIVVDSNIIFSAMLNVESKFAQLLIPGSSRYTYFAPSYTKHEIYKYQDKIIEIGKIDPEHFDELFDLITKRIILIEPSTIPQGTSKRAFDLCFKIDENDIEFVATAIHLKALLWTGDKKLMKGLKAKGFDSLITTEELYSKLITRES